MFGTLIYPTVWFSNETRFKPPEPDRLSPVFLETDLCGEKTWFLENGNVIVGTDERRAASKILNSYLLCHSLLLDLVLPVTEKELYKARLKASPKSIIPTSEALTAPRNIISILPETRPKLQLSTTVHTLAQLKVVLEEARLVCEAEHRTGLMVFYKGWNAIRSGAYRSGVILGWTAIEIMLNVELKVHLVAQGVDPDFASRIVDELTAYRVLAHLRSEAQAGRFTPSSAPNRFSSDQVDRADKIRKLRNKLVHEGKRPTREEAEECHELATAAMWRLLRLSGIKHNDYLGRMQDISGKSA